LRLGIPFGDRLALLAFIQGRMEWFVLDLVRYLIQVGDLELTDPGRVWAIIVSVLKFSQNFFGGLSYTPDFFFAI
jgi:hypothetical protein